MSRNESEDRWLEISHRSTVDFAITSIKSLCLTNGGAILVTMGFIGNVWGDRGTKDIISDLKYALIFFVTAMVCSLSIGLLSYVSQAHYTHFEDNKGNTFRNCAVILTIASILAFIVGCVFAYLAFS